MSHEQEIFEVEPATEPTPVIPQPAGSSPWFRPRADIAQAAFAMTEINKPQVLVDWLPWNHTFGSNQNIHLTLFSGGSLYIDDGKPTPNGMPQTFAVPAARCVHHLVSSASAKEELSHVH